MNEVLSLFPVLLLVYVLQCIAAAPPGSAVFLVDSRMRGRLLQHSWQVGQSQHHLFLLNPFFPSRSAVYVCGFPFSFLTGPTGEIRGIALPATRSFQGGLTFDTPRHFTARSKQLLSDDLPVATLHSEAWAAHLAAFLMKLQSAPSAKRYTVIDRELRRMFALDTLKQRLELLAHCTLYLDSLCLSLLLFVFLLAPAAIYRFGLSRIWPTLLVTLLLFCSMTLVAFHRARRRLYPKSQNADLQSLFTIGLSPFAAIRAIDHLVGDVLEDFHPVAVAFVLLPEKEFLKFAEKELRRAKFIAHDPVSEKSIACFLSAQKFDPQLLLQPPTPEDDRSRTYCPACLTQYVIEEGTCRDCGGVPLEPLRCKVHN